MYISKKAYAELKRKSCDLDAEIRARSKLIKLLKCCGNCHITKGWDWTPDCYCHYGKQETIPSMVCYKWELREKKETDDNQD